MTKIKNNSLLKGLSGKMGETHAYRKVRGRMHMVNLPDTGGPMTESQRLFTERFTKAARYAKAQVNDPAMKAVYETGITDKKFNPYLVAVSDSLNAPKVNEIKADDYGGAVGHVIRIDATDDFRVVRVRVIIRAGDGAEIERGEAVQDPKNLHLWKYTATAANPAVSGSKIIVTAFDLPENETTREKRL